VPFQNLKELSTCSPGAAVISIRVGLTETGRGCACATPGCKGKIAAAASGIATRDKTGFLKERCIREDCYALITSSDDVRRGLSGCLGVRRCGIVQRHGILAAGGRLNGITLSQHVNFALYGVKDECDDCEDRERKREYRERFGAVGVS
jgi:hypothetical protein